MDYLVHHLVRTAAARTPDKEALVQGDTRLTYRQVRREVAAIATGLLRAGCRRGDRVGVFMRPSVGQALSLLGISQAGCVFVPIHHSLFPGQVAHIVNDCGMAGLIADGALLEPALPQLESSPGLKFLVADRETPGAGAGRATLVLDRLRETPGEGPADVAIGLDLAAILYTSGSTGKPKGVMLSHANILAGARIVAAYLEIGESERILAALPFSFDAGLNQLTSALLQGGTLVVVDFVLAGDLLRVLRAERITGLAGVPTLWNLLARSRSLGRDGLPDLRYITNTGGVLHQEVIDRLRAALPATQVFLMYGLTEAFRSTYLPPAELDRRPGSMGKAIPDTEILVVDERGRRCGPSETGELVHHGPTVALGYWGDPPSGAQVFRPHPFPEEGRRHHVVVYSGDLVRTDEDGYLYFVGRRDKMIKSSGFRISPSEVEEVLLASGRLREAAAVGLPDDLLGQRIKAFVVPDGDTGAVPPDLEDFCKAHMPGYMVPQLFEALDALPKTPHGKIDYQALRDRDTGGSRPADVPATDD